MSGVGVITRWRDTPDATNVKYLRSGIQHRGSGQAATRQVGEVVLLHAQFATTPEAALESQPTRHVSRDVWLTADARIDNRADLRTALRGRVEHPLDTDADFILAAYERWGDHLAAHLLGDFAFAVWDAERQHLLVVRDQVGIRPMYWALTGDGGFVASSTLRATLDASGRQRDLDPVYLANYATFSERDQEHTPFEAVRRLPGGHCLAVASGGQVRTWRYWDLPDEYLDISVDSAAALLREIVTEAVTCRLRAPSPIGIQLSGGFDSTTVAGLARTATGPSSLITYALTFPGQECDESVYIDAAEAHFQLRSRRLNALDTPPFDFARACRDALGVPLLPDNQWATPLAQMAASDGCRAVLTGQGGDHALCGDIGAVADDLFEQGQFRNAWHITRRDGQRGRSRVRGLARGIARAHVLHHETSLAARLLARRTSRKEARYDNSTLELLGPALRQFVIPREPRSRGSGRFDLARHERRYSYTGAGNYFIELWDQTAIDGGVEYRHPFLDVRVIEFVSRLGENVIAAGGQRRGLHRRAFGDILPALTLDRNDAAIFDRPWIDAALAPAQLVCDADNELLRTLIDQSALRKHTATCATDPLASFNMWRWWGAVAVGLWALNYLPS